MRNQPLSPSDEDSSFSITLQPKKQGIRDYQPPHAQLNPNSKEFPGNSFKEPSTIHGSRHSFTYEESKANISLFSLNTTLSSVQKVSFEHDTLLPPVAVEECTVQRDFFPLEPYNYQIEIFNRIRNEWNKSCDRQNQYGNIVYLETGMGKTHIVVMLLNYFFNGIDYGDISDSESQITILKPSTDEELSSRRLARESMRLKTSKKVFFIVPVQNLVEQQAVIIERYTNLVVGRYHGKQKRSKYYSELEAWREEFEKHDVFVAMAKKFYDLLMHGFVKMDEISIVVFDECHHTDQDHLYNLIMRDFFFHKFNDADPECRRPKILGLTASPIKQKIDKIHVLSSDIESMLQNLSNNLYSRFVTFSAEQIRQFTDQQNNLVMQIEKYKSNFDSALQAVDEIEGQVIKKIAKLVSLPEGTYKIHELERLQNIDQKAEHIVQLLNLSFMEEVEKQDQNNEILKFLKGRRNLIELNSTWTKIGIDIAEFKTNEDKLLILLCLIMLKKVNNLLIELGPLAVKTFFMDLKHDLLVFSKQSSQLGAKKEATIQIIDDYCKSYSQPTLYLDQVEDCSDISSKVHKLVKIMHDSYAQNSKLKTIIFVKDRSVAFYLQKMLSGNKINQETQDLNENYDQKVDESHLCDGLLPKSIFKVGFALGQQQKNLVNQAYRSTNIQKADFFKDVLQGMPSCSSVKMTPSQLKETIQSFKTGRINVLIATNVVEEGLDVSTCNQVICLNELTTVKAFIQMKGRARQANSRFVFLCSEEEIDQVMEDQKNFLKVIDIMKKITLRGDQVESGSQDGSVIQTARTELLPLSNICMLKLQDETSFHEEIVTGAKISMRDAKQLIELFCLVCAEVKIKVAKITRQIQPSLEVSEASLSTNQSENHLENKPNYVIRESQKGGVKYFICVLYMPECCKDRLRKVNPVHAFVKKRDAENHVALLAIKKLRAKGLIDEYLFPSAKLTGGLPLNMSSFMDKDLSLSVSTTLNLSSSLIRDSSILNGSQLPVFDPSQPRKRKQITDEEKLKAHQKSKQFQMQIKQEKPAAELEQGSNLVNKVKFKENFEQLKILVFKGSTKEDEYPYRNTQDFLGLLFDRSDFCNPSLSFTMFQESKQRDKNLEHLNNLLDKNLISGTFRNSAEQSKEELGVVISEENSFGLCDDLKKQGRLKKDKKYSNLQLFLTKLQFFHTWMFYYLYSADHKFLKAIFKNKFTFVQHLFKQDIDRVRLKHSFTIRQVYGDKAAQGSKKVDPKGGQINFHNAYGVPVKQTKDGLQVNWTLIERVIDYVRDRIQELRMPTERHIVVSKYNLEELSKKDPAKMTSRIWDSKFQGNRHVVVDKELSSQKWDESLDLSQGKKDEQRQFADRIRSELQGSRFMSVSAPPFVMSGNSQSSIEILKHLMSTVAPEEEFILSSTVGRMSSIGESSVLERKERQLLMTPQEYYFVKQGQLQIKRFNTFIFKCRKERHFVDFGKKRKDETLDMSMTTQPLFSQRKVNTIFDLPDQMLSLAPVSYNQYQVLQQTCFHVLNLNEFLLIEKFIKKFFKPEHNTTKCLLKYRDPNKKDEHDLVPCDYSTKLFMTHNQIQAELGESVLVVETKRQLQSKLALIREALTAPSACRDYDYERLEFYGDSIIGFLVILELFLLNPSNQEGDLDFFRIGRVSNENFYKINKQQKFYKYMITDPHHVFSGFMPTGLQDQAPLFFNYQTKITVKTYNELNNKFKELKKIKERLRLTTDKNSDDMDQMFLKGDFYSLAKIIIKDNSLVKKICECLTQHYSEGNNKYPNQASSDFLSLMHRQDHESVLRACKIMFQAKFSPSRILKFCVDVCHGKIQNQIEKQKKARDNKNAENRRAAVSKKKQFYYKQYADVVESVTGAVTIACGLNLTQAFLKGLDILEHDQQSLNLELEKLTAAQQLKAHVLEHTFYKPNQMHLVEKIIGYEFKCKSWLVQALTHKSYIDQSVESTVKMRLDDYERLEFLGDSVLNYLVAKFFFISTQFDQERKMPKELHKMKTAVINNTLLSLIVIENGIHEHIVYNKKAMAFKDQFDKYVRDVAEMVRMRGTTAEIANHLAMFDVNDIPTSFDLDELYESNLKIFGDVFESLIGAVFLDCRDIDQTWGVLQKLLMPYIKVYADLETLQDHARTKLLELWNQRSYTKRFKCTHESKQIVNRDEIRLTAVLIGHNPRDRHEIFSETYKKDAKNKNRAFYKKLYNIVQQFIQQCDEKGPHEEQKLLDNPAEVREGLRKIINRQITEEGKRNQAAKQQ